MVCRRAVPAALIVCLSALSAPAAGSVAPTVRAAAALPKAGLSAASLQTAKQLYERAQRAESRLRDSQTAMQSRERWESVGRQYRAVVLSYPRSGYCDDALHYEGGVYRDAAERFGDRGYAVRAANAWGLLARGYPSSRWVSKALYEQVRLYAGRLDDPAEARRLLERLRQRSPRAAETRMAAAILDPPRSASATTPNEAQASSRRGRPASQEASRPAATPTSKPKPADPPTTVRNIRHWVGESHTRVVIDLSGPTPHTEGRLENPDRVFFDLHGATPGADLGNRAFPIEGSHLRQIRLGVPEEKTTRVVLDFSSIREVTVFALPDPYRLVVDIHGAPPVVAADGASDGSATLADARDARDTGETVRSATGASPQGTTESSMVGDRAPAAPSPTESGYSVARQLGAGVRRIVIDAGHGGKDPGTRSGRLLEKDIALEISKLLRDDLEKRGFEVIMTREKDVFIPLEQRAFIANSRQADIFVSVHVNAARNRRARGLETFYLNLATSDDAAAVAARENASTAGVRIADLDDLLKQILNHTWKEESREFATSIQNELATSILGRVKHPHNRGVKTAGFHVLLGAKMPAVLVEVGFVSNRDEAKQLRSAAHRKKLAAAIADGITRYAATLGPVTETTATRNDR